VGKDVVNRTWRKVNGDWDAWNARSLKDEPIVRLILDGTVVRVRLDKKATSISLLVTLGVREDGQKVLLAVKNMGLDGAGWHSSPQLVVPENFVLLLLPLYAPELNSEENIWEYLRSNWLNHCLWKTYQAILARVAMPGMP
jgi:Transposase, Mutator family